MKIDREQLGIVVRQAWVRWAHEQPAPKPSWLVPWEGLSEPDKEVDRQIGEAIVAYLASTMSLTEATMRAWVDGVVRQREEGIDTDDLVKNFVAIFVAQVRGLPTIHPLSPGGVVLEGHALAVWPDGSRALVKMSDEPVFWGG